MGIKNNQFVKKKSPNVCWFKIRHLLIFMGVADKRLMYQHHVGWCTDIKFDDVCTSFFMMSIHHVGYVKFDVCTSSNMMSIHHEEWCTNIIQLDVCTSCRIYEIDRHDAFDIIQHDVFDIIRHDVFDIMLITITKYDKFFFIVNLPIFWINLRFL